MNIYLATSWKNPDQPRILKLLRGAGHTVYDFRNPQRVESTGRTGQRLGEQVASGFSWSEVDEGWRDWTPEQFVDGLQHEASERGFRSDFEAMQWADACVCLLPSGVSAGIEAGWCAGAGKLTVVHVCGIRDPDLMYKVADAITTTDEELLSALLARGSSSR